MCALVQTRGTVLHTRHRAGQRKRMIRPGTTVQFQGAVIEEQGVTFGVVVVQPQVLGDSTQSHQVIQEMSKLFGGIPTVLMGQDPFGATRYYGRSDIANFMASVPLEAVPWKEYSISM